jgi:phage tail sheath protein FI
LPKFYRPAEALEHQRRLEAELRLAGDKTDSYVALYHPWLVARDPVDDRLSIVHPTGAVCGAIAARSLSRGAWVAPANQVLRGVLSTHPALNAPGVETCYQAGVNPIRHQVRGPVIWGAYTQSTDPELEDLNVRRLLILLRRLALYEGNTYVFAPHSPAFRRRVQQQFEQRLAWLYARGAFAGRDPSEAYRVVIDETVNTANSVEQGRLIVELRVAPSQPVTFITVRLVQSAGEPPAVQEVL